MVPPFYYKGVSDDGVFRYYSEVIERVGDDRLAVYLYHIPQLTNVPINFSVIERLLNRYPKTVAGAKDSSGDWRNSEAMIESYGAAGFDVFPASEALLSKALAIGGAGCISATVNMKSVRDSCALRVLEHRRGRSPAGAGRRAPEDLSGAYDDCCDEARGRGVRARAGLARRAPPTDHHGRRGSFDVTRRTARRRVRHAELSTLLIRRRRRRGDVADEVAVAVQVPRRRGNATIQQCDQKRRS
jgi:hypothetical protein